MRLGKLVRGALYVHADAVPALPVEPREAVARAEMMVPDHPWNVARVGPGKVVGLLLYPGFDDEAFPRLVSAARIDLAQRRVSVSSHRATTNPLILHRKELLLRLDDPRREPWARTTRRVEEAGLFRDPTRIGRLGAWTAMLAAAGLDVEGRPC